MRQSGWRILFPSKVLIFNDGVEIENEQQTECATQFATSPPDRRRSDAASLLNGFCLSPIAYRCFYCAPSNLSPTPFLRKVSSGGVVPLVSITCGPGMAHVVVKSQLLTL
jgi:hypothetical protein